MAYDSVCQPGMTGDRSRLKLSCGTSAVLGVLQHTVTVDDDVVALVAWLAPYGKANAINSQGLLMPDCGKTVSGTPCIVNLDQTGRMTLDNVNYISSEFDTVTTSTNLLYWRSWSKPNTNAATDSMAWVERGPNAQSYPSCKVSGGCLAVASPALETFVPLCANVLDYSDPVIQGTPGDGSYPPNTFCRNQPLKNYYSPVAQAPLAFSVPITPATLKVTASGSMPRHPYFNFHSSDLDGHQMQQRLPRKWVSVNKNLGESCLQWIAQPDGTRRLVQMDSNLCKSFFDLDRDASR